MRDTLRDDQLEALDALRQAVAAGEKRICMQAPTGYGKTVLTSKLVHNARERGKKVLFTVPMISLVDQTVEMFASQHITEVGVIQADHHMTDWNQPVQVASVQTLMKRTLPQADIVVIDECHKLFQCYPRWMHPDSTPQWAKVPIIGLSATPWTKGLGGRGLFSYFYRASTIQEMIDGGHLSPFKVYAPTHPDLSDVRTVAGDYHEGELSLVMRDGRLVADAVETWLRLGQSRATLCYAVDRAHAKALQQKFEAAGVSCEYQDAFTKDADHREKKGGTWVMGRKSIKKGFHDGSIKVVCNVETLTTGVDWDVRCISMCRPTKSDMLFVQIVGRGLRTADGKSDCLILDHSDNHTRLGFVTDIDESYTGLHDGRTPTHENRTEGIRLPKECPKCAYLKPPKMALCPACGFVAKMVSHIKPDPGELRELKRPPRAKPEEDAPKTQEEKAAFFAELKGYGMLHGYQSGWASHKYRERIGTWPAWDMKHVSPRTPRAVTVSWITSRAIRWARRREDGDARNG